jgi:hypothetical protein
MAAAEARAAREVRPRLVQRLLLAQAGVHGGRLLLDHAHLALRGCAHAGGAVERHDLAGSEHPQPPMIRSAACPGITCASAVWQPQACDSSDARVTLAGRGTGRTRATPSPGARLSVLSAVSCPRASTCRAVGGFVSRAATTSCWQRLERGELAADADHEPRSTGGYHLARPTPRSNSPPV